MFASPRWLVGFTFLAVLLALPFAAQAQIYNATGANELFSSATGWSAKPVSNTNTVINLNKGATGWTCTNDVAGVFVLNQLTRIAGSWAFGAAAGASFEFTNNGTTLAVVSNGNANASLNINAPVKLDGNTIWDGGAAPAGAMGLPGIVSGPGSITKNNGNTLTINGTNANTFTGGLTINAGTVFLNKVNAAGNAGVLAIPGNVTIGNGSAPATLQYGYQNQLSTNSIVTLFGTGANAGILMLTNYYDTIGGLASTGGAGIVENNGTNTARTLTLNVNGADQTFDGIIQDGTATGTKSLAITKTGTNAQILTGVSTYTGGTIISSGALTLSGSGALSGTTSINVYSNATFNITSGLTVGTGANVANLYAAGTIAGGTVTLAANGHLQTFNGVTSIAMPVFVGLTLSSGSTNDFNFSPVTNSLATVSGANALTINGGVINLYVTNSTTPFTTLGTYNLFQYSGSIGGTGVSALSVGNPQSGLSYTFSANGTYVQVTIAAAASSVFWNTDSSASWNTGADWTTTAVPNAAGYTANFGGGGTTITAPRTVTLDGNETVGTLTFNSAQPFTITPGSPGSSALTLDNGSGIPVITSAQGTNTVAAPIALPSSGASAAITVAGVATLNLTSPISGTGGLTNAGTGTLNLAGTNTFAGGVTLTAGKLLFNSPTAIGTGALVVNGTVAPVLDNTSGATIANANNNAIYLNSNLAFTGTTNLNLGTGPVALGGNYGFVVNGGTLTVGGVISGTNNLQKTGTGTLVLTGNSTVTNIVNGAGTLSLNAPGGAIASTNYLTVNGGLTTVDQADTVAVLNAAANAVVNGPATLTVNTLIHPNIAINITNIFNVNLAGPAQFEKTGQGTTILAGTNSYSGGNWITGANSRLMISNNGTLGSTAGALLMDTAGDVLDLGGTAQTVGTVTLTNGTIQNGTLTNTSFTAIQGVVSNNASLAGTGTLTMNGTGNQTLALYGVNTYTGNTTINGGWLLVDGSLGNTAVTVNGGNLGGNGTINGSVTVGSGANVSPGVNTNTAGVLTVVGNLTLTAGDTLTFLETNSTFKSEIIVGGTLTTASTTIALPNMATLPDGNYTLIHANSGISGSASDFAVTSISPKTYTIAISGNDVVLQVSGPATVTWTGDGSANHWDNIGSVDWSEAGTAVSFVNGDYVTFGNSTNQNVNLTTTVAPASLTFNSTNNYAITGVGGIAGTQNLSLWGKTTVTLNTANSYSGGTVVTTNCVLGINSDSSLGAAPGSATAGSLLLIGGTISNSATMTLNANRGIAVGDNFDINGVGKLDTAANQTLTYAGIIADNGSWSGGVIVNPYGAGTNILSGPNTFTGPLSLTNGTLTLQNNQSAANGGIVVGGQDAYACVLNIAAGANVAVSSSAIFQVGNNAAAGVATAFPTVNVYGAVTNQGALLAGRCSLFYVQSGGVVAQSGNLTVQAYGNLNAALSVNAGGTVVYTGANPVYVNGAGGVFGAQGILTIYGQFITSQGFVQTNVLTSGTTGYGVVSLDGGTLSLTASVTNLFGGNNSTTNVNSYIHCTLTASNTINLGGNTVTNYTPITGTGSLTVTGGGILVMAGTNSYTGNTTINGATLDVQQPSLCTTSSVAVASSGVLQLDFAGVTNQVAALVLNGVSEPAGVYNSGNTSGRITGGGSLLVVPTGPGKFTNPTAITGFTITGANISITGTNGQAGDAYYLLSSTNLALPIGQWTPVATNIPGTAGTYTFTATNAVNSAYAQQFFILSNTNK